MRLLDLLSPRRLMACMPGREAAARRARHLEFQGLSDHYLRDIGLMRHRQPGPRHEPWMM